MTVTASTPAYRFRRGTAEYVSIPSPASTMINPGDLIFNNSGVAAVASVFTWTTNSNTTQTNFRLQFLGIAVDQKLASDASTRNILVMTKGEFAYPCAALSGAQHIGSFVAPDKDTGNNLLDQQLAVVTGRTASIGVLGEEAASGATSLVVRLQGFETITANSTSN